MLICLASISHVIAAQIPFGLYSLPGSIGRLVILSKHLPGWAVKEKEKYEN